MAGDPAARVVVAVDVEDTPYCATGADVVADRLFSLGASAVSELPDDTDVRVRLVADLPSSAIDGLAASGLVFRLLEADPSWADGWRAHAATVVAGERLAVRPEWVEPDPVVLVGRTEVVLDAALAFGSGSHPTTRMCLGAVDHLVSSGDRVLDVGCGTGVLGVSALLLGAGSLVAVDVEPAAVAATRRTAGLNHVGDRLLEVSSRSVPDVTSAHGPFDLVLANLLIPAIEQIGAHLVDALGDGGHLVVSGLLVDHVDRAVGALGSACAVQQVIDDGVWAAIVANRRPG